MIDRYTITENKETVSSFFKIMLSEDFKPKYNCAPSQLLPVIANQNPSKLQYFRWGIMADLSNNKKMVTKLFNIDAVTAISKQAEKKELMRHRCIIPASGFYLWKQVAKKKIIPYYFFVENGKFLKIAGIWETGNEFSEQNVSSFRMITQSANQMLFNYQEDMPMMLNDQDAEKWLDSKATEEEIRQIINRKNTQPHLAIHPVSPEIIHTQKDHPQLIKPSVPSDQFGNYTLFG